MDRVILQQFIVKKLQRGLAINILVRGSSMNPVLKEGDLITIRRKECKEGDILVFLYAGDELLVHRLLKRAEGYFYCKGDNSFRLEQVPEKDILGVVEKLNGKAIRKCSSEFLEESERINQIFIAHQCDVEKVRETPAYQEYCKKYITYTM